MNHLELLKDQLKIKPVLKQQQHINVIINPKNKTSDEDEQINPNVNQDNTNIQIVNKIDKNFNRELLMKNMANYNLNNQINQPQTKQPTKLPNKHPTKIIIEDNDINNINIKQPKKIIIEDDDIDDNNINIKQPKKIIIEENIEEIDNIDNVDNVDEYIKPPKKQKKIIIEDTTNTSPVSTDIIIGDTNINNRLPIKKQSHNILASQYYLNNREIFINFINTLFEPYRKEFQELSNDITCETMGKSNNDFALMTHQKIVIDYMNIYTPYRGLLLNHGLGSGKSCTSIGIAEGMKDYKKVMILTPASLKTNYNEELKKCGDLIYKKNQYWEWISLNNLNNQSVIKTLSSVLNLPISFIKKNNGAWLVNIKKKSNYSSLNAIEKKTLNAQIDMMISSKYQFISYNGLTMQRLNDLTQGFTINPFDNKVIVVDEAHNLVGRIVNKYNASKKNTAHNSISEKIYEYLLSASNAKIILLTGTPIINYPNEFGILFNILRGYIKTWSLPLDIKTTTVKVNKAYFENLLLSIKSIDYIDYSPSNKTLVITKNPLGFKNKIKKINSEYLGVTNNKTTDGKIIIDEDMITDDEFIKKITSLLNKNKINVKTSSIKITNQKALPDKLDLFKQQYINDDTKEIKNIDGLKRRIIGLTSYFKSPQEKLLPRYNKEKDVDYFIVKIPMSDYQFNIYETARVSERKTEKIIIKPKKEDESTPSTYRIFSRLYCNYAMTNRPTPLKKNIEDIIDDKGNMEDDAGDVLDADDDTVYDLKIKKTLKAMNSNPTDFLSENALQTHSPKFLKILNNIKNPENVGLHLIYSQFRTMEGIGIFSLVLDHNGFTQFKVKKNEAGIWDINISEENFGKPTYALYTGTESAEEKELIRNIYNGHWEHIPENMANKLKRMSTNNNMGEIIKIFMITSSGSEGINLKNTQFVHIIEPYWNPVRLEQVIGRARRLCSHSDLPIEFQKVMVFVYLMTFSRQQLTSDNARELNIKDLGKGKNPTPVTSDELLYQISEIKESVNNQLIEVIKDSSFDCSMYSNRSSCLNFGNVNKNKFSYVPDYTKQSDDKTVLANKHKITWTGIPIKIYDKDYVGQKISNIIYNIFSKESYERGNPIQVGVLNRSTGKFDEI